MNVIILGGGPAGLYFGILMKRLDSAHDVTIVERDGPSDTYGWGIVFSDQTFSYLLESDEPSCRRIASACATWDNVDVVHRDRKISIHGNHFSGVSRLAFLNILQARAKELGVEIRYRTPVTDLSELPVHDLLVGADGANSLVRRTHATAFGPELGAGRNKYIWLGTHRLFHGLTLTFRETPAGAFAAHSYKFNATTSAFIVECTEQTWHRAGLGAMPDEATCRYLEHVFERDLEGHALLSNNFVRWINFTLVRNRRWHHDKVVLLGDALHTAHFSIGSGTKLALEDAIALAAAFRDHGADTAGALAAFERDRRPIVEKYQETADESREWFENMEAYLRLDPLQLAYALMTRSGKIDHEKLRLRDPRFVAEYERRLESKSS